MVVGPERPVARCSNVPGMTPRQYARALAIAEDERADPNERQNALRLCAEYEAAHGRPDVAHGKRPWWTLKISIKDSGFWLINNSEFRRALRALRDGVKQYQYAFEWATVKAVQDGEVDWVWFPDREPWNVPYKMWRSTSDPLAVVDRRIERSEHLTEWIRERQRRAPSRPSKRKRPLGDGQLPGCRKVRR